MAVDQGVERTIERRKGVTNRQRDKIGRILNYMSTAFTTWSNEGWVVGAERRKCRHPSIDGSY